MLSTIANRQRKLVRTMILPLLILAIVVLTPVAPMVHAQTVVTTIPADFKPSGVGVNVLTNEIYVATTRNLQGNAEVLNGTTNIITATFTTGTGTSAFKVAVNPA